MTRIEVARTPTARRQLGLVALLTAASFCAPLVNPPSSAGATRDNATASRVIHVAPSSDDTRRLQAALDAASAAGPGAVIELAAGTYRVARPLVGVNFSGTIRGAGIGRTTVLADGSTNPNGLFPDFKGDNIDAPFLIQFYESDVDRQGQPLDNRRSQRITMRDLTLGASGRTEPHLDVNAEAVTQRLYSLVWVTGFRPAWTNSQGQTPLDTGFIDAEHAKVSTVRVTFTSVHFDGRNRARSHGEPGGPFDPNPDVRNGIGVAGGAAFPQPNPDFEFLFKPVNAAVRLERSLFTDLPGQSGIFAPQLVGPRDRAWTYGPDAVAGALKVTDTTFKNTPIGVLSGDLSDIDVTVDDDTFRHTDYGLNLWNNYQATDNADIAFPPPAASRVTVSDSTFHDTDVAAIWMDEYLGPSRVSFLAQRNDFVLTHPTQVGVLGNSLDGARFIDNDFSGKGYGALVAVTSSRWLVQENDFCHLRISPPATAHPQLGLPPNETNKPVVLFDSSDFRMVRNRCP